jgi:hypothetical protein
MSPPPGHGLDLLPVLRRELREKARASRDKQRVADGPDALLDAVLDQCLHLHRSRLDGENADLFADLFRRTLGDQKRQVVAIFQFALAMLALGEAECLQKSNRLETGKCPSGLSP